MNEPMEVPDRLAVLLKHFAELNDERESWRVAYPLKEALLLVTCATIATCDDFDEIVLWGEHHLDFLRRFSDFHQRAVRPQAARSIRRCSRAASSPSSPPCGRDGTTSSPSTARPPDASTTSARGSKPSIS